MCDTATVPVGVFLGIESLEGPKGQAFFRKPKFKIGKGKMNKVATMVQCDATEFEQTTKYNLYLIDQLSRVVLEIDSGVTSIEALCWWMDWQTDSMDCIPMVFPQGFDVGELVQWEVVRTSQKERPVAC